MHTPQSMRIPYTSFGDEFRPVPLAKFCIGYGRTNELQTTDVYQVHIVSVCMPVNGIVACYQSVFQDEHVDWGGAGGDILKPQTNR